MKMRKRRKAGALAAYRRKNNPRLTGLPLHPFGLAVDIGGFSRAVRELALRVADLARELGCRGLFLLQQNKEKMNET